MNLHHPAAEAAADWWTARLQQGDREVFREHLALSVACALEFDRVVVLECDYDPQGLLLDAVRAAGVECRGFMFSAQGILPQKHSLDVFADKLVPKEGYGNWTEIIPIGAST